MIQPSNYSSSPLKENHDDDDVDDNDDDENNDNDDDDGDDDGDDDDDTFICCLLSLNQDPLVSLEGSAYFVARLQFNPPHPPVPTI